MKLYMMKTLKDTQIHCQCTVYNITCICQIQSHMSVFPIAGSRQLSVSCLLFTKMTYKKLL